MQRVDAWLNLNAILPRWTTPANASPAPTQDWQAIYNHLQKHEKVHFNNGVEATEHIVAALRSTTDSSCSNLEATAYAVT